MAHLATAIANAKTMETFERYIVRKRLEKLQQDQDEMHKRLHNDEEQVKVARQQVNSHVRGDVARIVKEAQDTKAHIQADRQSEQMILDEEKALRNQVLADTQELQKKIEVA